MLSNQPVDRNQATLDSLVGRPAAGDDGGDDESSTSSSDVSSEEGVEPQVAMMGSGASPEKNEMRFGPLKL